VKRNSVRILFLLLLVFLPLSMAMARGVTFLVNPSYSPFSYGENGELKGLAVELVKLLSSESGLEAEMVAMPFEEAYAKLQDGGEYALPTLVFTPQRKSQFNWVGPIAVTPTYLYARDDSPDIHSLDDAKKAGKVGAVRGYYSQQLLAEQGLDTVIFEDEATLLKSLLEGDIDLAPFNSDVYTHLTENIPESSKLHATIVLDLDMTYIGFSKDVPLDTLRRWQEGLDSLKSSGDFAGLYEKWLPGRPIPGIYTLLTEEYPPVTYMGEGGPAGFVTEIVRELMERNGMKEEIFLVPWAIGYELASNLPNVLLFSMDQTELRKPLFEWIGPVGRNTAYLYGRVGSAIAPADLDEARKVGAIATTKDWWTEQLLRDLGFTNLKSFLDPLDTVRQLMNGEADLAIFTDLTVSELVQNAGYQMKELNRLLEIQTNYFYVAASMGTDPEMVLSLQKTLDSMKRDGSFEEILRKYVPNVLITPLLLQSSTPATVRLQSAVNSLQIGELASVTLEENGSTGYVWDVRISNPNVLSLAFVKQSAADTGKASLTGASYEVEWTFRAEHPGECVIVFSLQRPWESVHPVKTFAINVKVE
jgi:polar amino acid transport system substrate-binding protein